HPLNGSGQLNNQVLAAVVTAALNIPLALFLAGRVGIPGVVISQAGVVFLVAIPIQLVGVFKVLGLRPGGASARRIGSAPGPSGASHPAAPPAPAPSSPD